MNIFEILFYQPIYNIIVVFYHLLGDNLGLAIIAIGIVSRFVLAPVTFRQAKLAESSKEFSEKSKEIKKKYKDNKVKQQEELLALQREYLPAQLGGCLPLIFQLIVFINVYSVIRNLISSGAEGFNNIAYSFVPKLSSEVSGDFLGIMDLKLSPGEVSGSDIYPYLLLVLLVGITQFFSTKLLTSLRNKAQKEEEKPKKNKKKNEDPTDDFAEIMQRSTKQVGYILPFFLMLVSYQLPAGLSIYLITTSLFVILQQVVYFYYKERKKKLSQNPDVKN
ncbi:MAG: YidC/Oxa1 family membrane protein insertase [Candidatus Dojkabacteria bacterium]